MKLTLASKGGLPIPVLTSHVNVARKKILTCQRRISRSKRAPRPPFSFGLVSPCELWPLHCGSLGSCPPVHEKVPFLPAFAARANRVPVRDPSTSVIASLRLRVTTLHTALKQPLGRRSKLGPNIQAKFADA